MEFGWRPSTLLLARRTNTLLRGVGVAARSEVRRTRAGLGWLHRAFREPSACRGNVYQATWARRWTPSLAQRQLRALAACVLRLLPAPRRSPLPPCLGAQPTPGPCLFSLPSSTWLSLNLRHQGGERIENKKERKTLD